MSEPKPPWEAAALELGKLDYSLSFGKRCEIIQHAAEAYAAQQTAALRAERDKLAIAFEATKTMLADVAKERDDADHDRQLAQDENAALAASVARLREALEKCRVFATMSPLTLEQVNEALAATPPPALAPDAAAEMEANPASGV
jgi:hypothetical protein